MAADPAIDPREQDAAVRQVDLARRAELLAEAKAKGWHRFFEPNYNVNYSARLYSPHYDNPWDKEEQGAPHQRWMDTMGHRAAIRAFSRGIMGAGLMTVGDGMTHRYIPTSVLRDRGIVGIEGFAQGRPIDFAVRANYGINQALNGLAKAGDVVLGTPIKALFGEKAVTFDRGHTASGIATRHTLGEEWVKVTLAFAMGSIGDAWGRNIVGLFDPNVKKSWIHDGHFDVKDFAKSTGKAALRIFSFNQMEDWFAGPIYVYQRALGQHVLDKAWPGSKMMLQNQVAGAAFKVDHQNKVTGDMLIPGMLDFQWRFPIYNVDTLLFRDGFHHVKHLWQHRHDAEKPTVERGFIDETLKYGLKTTVKALTYMMPVTPLFWLPRVSSQMETPRGVRFDAAGKPVEMIGEKEIAALEPASTLVGKIVRPIGRFTTGLGDVVGRGFASLPFVDPKLARKTGARYVANALSYTAYMDAKYETANWWDTPQMDAALYRVVDGIDHLSWKEIKAGTKDVGNVIARLPVSIDTEYLTHESRGAINSTQQALDAADLRDGHLVKTFAQKQLEHKIARQHEKLAAGKASRDPSVPVANENAPGPVVSSIVSHGQMPHAELLRA